MADPQTAARVIPLDPEDDTALQAYAEIHRRAEEAGDDYPVPFRAVELNAMFRDTTGAERWKGWLGRDLSGAPVAAGLLILTMVDNREKANLGVWVAPEHRGRKHGSAMVETLVAEARQEGRTTLLAGLGYPLGADESHPHRAFAARHGFRLSNTELHRVLDLPVPEARLAELAHQAAAHHEGYQLVEYVDDEVPPYLLPSYLDLVNALMTDAPTGEVAYEAGAMTPELFRADVQTMREAGRTVYRTIAVDAAGTAAAHSVLCLPGDDPGNVFQFGTLVSREHRGHRLGLAVKVRNIATVQSLHPDRTVVHTWNAASNTHMIAVNEAMGFRVVGETAEYVRRLVD